MQPRRLLFKENIFCKLAVLRYHVIVRTSDLSTRLKPDTNNETSTQHEIYLCLFGRDGDTGRRLLLRKPFDFPEDTESEKPLFAPGQVRISSVLMTKTQHKLNRLFGFILCRQLIQAITKLLKSVYLFS